MPELSDFNAYGYARGSMQHEILRALWHAGGIDATMAEKRGFTIRGQPTREMREMIAKKIIAPRVMTSVPLTLIWQLRSTAHDRHNDQKIANEAARLKIREYAPGGFQLLLRKVLR